MDTSVIHYFCQAAVALKAPLWKAVTRREGALGRVVCRILPALLLASLCHAQAPSYSAPDGRPIGQLFITSGTTRVACNPRMYFGQTSCGGGTYSFDPTSGSWSPTQFATQLATWVSGSLTALNAVGTAGVYPQGVIIWDLEGQEMIQTFSYVGHPAAYATFSPEMGTQCSAYSGTLGGTPTCTGTMTFADWMIAQFENAPTSCGTTNHAPCYWVGLTSRPQTVTQLTAYGGACTYNAASGGNNNQIGYNLNAAWPSRGAACQANSTWTASGTTNGPGLQQMVAAATEQSTIEADINFAFTRWGITHFYVDTYAYWTGTTTATIADAVTSAVLTYCQALSATCWTSPELPVNSTAYQYSIPYTAYQSHPEGTPPAIRAAYSQARSILNLANEFTGPPCGPNTIITATLNLGYNWGTWIGNIGAPGAGDIPMFSGWFSSSTENACAAKLYIQAHWF